MSKFEIKVPSTHLMNRMKMTMTSFILAISRRFRTASAPVSRFSVLFQQANHLRPMDHNITGDFLETEPMLFS
jgi:hypothetical protein